MATLPRAPEPRQSASDQPDDTAPTHGKPAGESGAFRRYLALLDGLADAPPHASIREVARRSGLSPATTYRLLGELRDLGVLVEDAASGRYNLSLRLWNIVERFDRRDDLRTAALPIMQDLRDDLGETVTLTIGAGRERIAILQVESRAHAHFGAAIGVPDRLDAGAPGKVIVAFLPPAAREAHLARVAATDGPEAADRLRSVTDSIRAAGHIVGTAERSPDFTVVSVPVRRPTGSAAALSVVGPSSRFTTAAARDALARVLAGASAIERALGAT